MKDKALNALIYLLATGLGIFAYIYPLLNIFQFGEFCFHQNQ